MKGFVWIVLVNYNGMKYMEEFMESVERQTYKNYGIVLVDSGSTDDSAQWFKDNYSQYKTITKKDNIGFAKGCNIGIKYAQSKGADYVLLLNIDTVLEDNTLEELVKNCDKNTVVSPKIYSSKDKVDIWYAGGKLDFETGCHVQYHDERLENGNTRPAHRISFASGCCMLIPMSVINKVGTLDETFFMYYDDDDLSIRFWKARVRMLYVPTTSLWHKVGGSYGGIRSVLTEYYFTRNRLYLMKKHKDVMKVSYHKIAWEIFKKKVYKPSANDKEYVPYVARALKDFYMNKMYMSSCKF